MDIIGGGGIMPRDGAYSRMQQLMEMTPNQRPPEFYNPLEKIEELLTCPICLDRYKNPKLLPCHHTFCADPCLEGLVDTLRRVVKCPECRAEHTLPYDGIKSYQTNYTLTGFLEIHLQATEDNAAELEAYIRRYNMDRCKVCDEKAELEGCPHCEKRVCLECKNTHMEMIKRDLSRLLNQVKRLSNRVTEASDGLTKGIESLKLNCETTVEEVKEYFRRYMKEMKKKEEHFHEEIDTFLAGETRLMRALRDSLELESSNITEACARVDAVLKGEADASDLELVRYKLLFTDGLDHLRAFHPDADDLFSKKIRFSVGQDANQLPAAIAQFGALLLCQPQFGGRFAQLEASYVTRAFNLGLESDHYPVKRKGNFDPADSSTWNQSDTNDAGTGSRRRGNVRKQEEETHTNIRYRRRGQLEEETWNRLRGGGSDRPPAPTPPRSPHHHRRSSPHDGNNNGDDDTPIPAAVGATGYADNQIKNSPWSRALTATAVSGSSKCAANNTVETGSSVTKSQPQPSKKSLLSPHQGATATSTTVAANAASRKSASSSPARDMRLSPGATQSRLSQSPAATDGRRTDDGQTEENADGQQLQSSASPAAKAVVRQGSSTDDALLNEKIETIRKEHQQRQQQLRAVATGGSLSGDGESSNGSGNTPAKKYGTRCVLAKAAFKATASSSSHEDEEEEEENSEIDDNNTKQPLTSVLPPTPKPTSTPVTKATAAGVTTAESKPLPQPPQQTATSEPPPAQSSSSGASTPQRSIPVLHYPARSANVRASGASTTNSAATVAEQKAGANTPTTVPKPKQQSDGDQSKVEQQSTKAKPTSPSARKLPMPQNPTSTNEQLQGGKHMLKKAVPPFLRKQQQNNNAKDTTSSSGDTSPAQSTTSGADWRKHLIPNPGAAQPPSIKDGRKSQRSNTISSAGDDQITRDTVARHQQLRRRQDSAERTGAVTDWSAEERRKRFVRSKTNPEIALGSRSTPKLNEIGTDTAPKTSAGADDSASQKALVRNPYRPRQRSRDSIGINSRHRNSASYETNVTAQPDAEQTTQRTATDRRNRYRRKMEAANNTTDPKDHQRFEINLSGSMSNSMNSDSQQQNGASNRFYRVFTQPKIDFLSKNKVTLKFGKKGAKDGEFNWPRGVAVVAASDEIVVCDSSNHRAVVFSHKGQFKLSFGKYGNGKGEFDCLAGVTTNKFRQFIITDRYNHRVQIFEQSGRFVREFGAHGQTNGRFNNPWGCAVDNQGFIYVCDKDNHRVQIFQADGNFVARFGMIGNRDGQFQNPHFIAVNRQNQLLVTDSSNHRVQVFDHNGHFQFMFGSEGFQDGQFKYPKGIAVDDQGFIVIADSGNNRIQVFYPDGRFYCSFGSWGAGDGQLKGVEGIAITLDGHIVASDRENHRVQLF